MNLVDARPWGRPIASGSAAISMVVLLLINEIRQLPTIPGDPRSAHRYAAILGRNPATPRPGPGTAGVRA
jgi:hypothetical protein